MGVLVASLEAQICDQASCPSKILPFRCRSGPGSEWSSSLPTAPEEAGTLMETWILNEIRAYLAYRKRHYPVHYWRTHDGSEVDLFLETRDGFIAAEIKSTTRWDTRYNRSLHSLKKFLGKTPLRRFGIYLGEKASLWDGIQVLPAADFLDQLWRDELIL